MKILKDIIRTIRIIISVLFFRFKYDRVIPVIGGITPQLMELTAARFLAAKEEGKKKLLLFIWSGGGNVESSMNLKNMLASKGIEYDAYTPASYSMAAYLFATTPGKRMVSSKGDVMFHTTRPAADAVLNKTIKLVDDLFDGICGPDRKPEGIYVELNNNIAKELKVRNVGDEHFLKTIFDGKDHYFASEDCIKLNIADSVFPI